MEFTKVFKKLGKKDVMIAGGKGASLGEMTRAGIPVPRGFVVLSDAFERFIEETDLNAEIDSILYKVKHEDISSVENASEEIKSLILGAEMPKDIKDDVMKNFKKLGAKYVAVRSSATSEDSASAAWAGQLDSFLNTTEDKVLENVKRCWASLFTPRAIFYRFEKNLHGTKISVAVVVQKMVESEVSGIAFSVHPVTQDYNQLIIEAGYGLGEAIVSGQITPDSYVIEKSPRRVIDKNVAEQEKGLFKVAAGGNEWKNVANGDRQKLSDKEISELSEIILRIEKHYGFPCDIEWATEKGKFYIVQSRPITTLNNEKEKVDRDLVDFYLDLVSGRKLYPPLQNYSAFMLGQGFHIRKYSEKWYGKDINYDVLILMKEGFSQVWFPEDYMKLTSEIALRECLENPIKFKKRIDYFNKNFTKADKIYSQYTYKKIDKLSTNKLITLLDKIRFLLWDTNAPLICVNDIDKEMVWIVVESKNMKLVRSEFDKLWERATEPVFESIDKVQSKDFSRLLKKERKWNDILEDCQYFYTDYHSAKPLKVIDERIKKDYGDFINDLRVMDKKLLLHSNELKKIVKMHATWFNKLPNNQKVLAEYIQNVMFLRDRRKIFINKCLTIIQRIAEIIFKRAGVEQNLIPYYTVDELLNGVKYLEENYKNLRVRKDGFELLIDYSGNVKMLNTSIDSDADKVKSYFMGLQSPNKNENVIVGQIGAKGKVRGRVRIVLDVNSNHGFQNNEILVTGMTRPEYVPLMKKAAAIVTDEGGITCHAAIVSRELGKPCVIGTKIATQILKTGDEIEVDAEKGVIKILKKA